MIWNHWSKLELELFVRYLVRMSVADKILIATSPARIAKSKLSNKQRIGIGIVAGSISRTVTSPLEVVKILMQVSTGNETVKDVVLKLWKEDGLKGFWRGNSAVCFRLIPQVAIKSFAFTELQKMIGHGNPATGIQKTICGASASAFAQVLTYPIDVIKTRVVVNPKKYTSIFSAFGTIVREEGPFSLYAGIAPAVSAIIPSEIALYYSYGTFKKIYTNLFSRNKPLSNFTNCMIGACAASFSQIFSFPFDVVKRRSMINDANGKPLVDGMITGFMKIIANEGPLALYKGFLPNIAKGIPFTALQFTFVDQLTKALVHK